MARRAAFLAISGILASLSAGCGSSPSEQSGGRIGPALGGQTGGETGPRCTAETAVEPIAMDASSELGFSPAEAMQPIAGEKTVSLTWSDGGSTRLHLDVVESGDAGYARSCSANEVDVRATLTTADGALAEAIDGELFALAADQASFNVEIPVASLEGTLSSRLELPEREDTLSIHLDFAAGTASGGIDAIDLSATESPTSVATF